MGPLTVEPVAGAVAWALARWATLREAQPVRPKQADLITVGQNWSLVPHTHIIRGIHIIMPDCRRLDSPWCVSVCVCVHVHVCFFTCVACQMFSSLFKTEKSGSMWVFHV